MKVRVQVIIETETEPAEVVEEVACLERGALQPDELGLTLAEAKHLLAGVQRTLVTQQAAEYLAQQHRCPDCGAFRPQKGQHDIVVCTLFGKLTIASPRFYTCACHPQSQASFSPLAELLHERTTPEMLYLQAKFAALVPYGVTIDLLGDVLPIGDALAVASVHRQVQQVAQRVEKGLGEELTTFGEGGPLPDGATTSAPLPEGPLVVALDGGFVRAREAEGQPSGWFEVISGRSAKAEGGDAKCFAFVQRYDPKPRRRRYEVLKAQGLQGNQLVTFLSDGGDDVRDLPLDLHPQAEHLLDWFHVTMRLTTMNQMAKGLPAESASLSAADVTKELESLKENVWHGNVFGALEHCDGLTLDLEDLQAADKPESQSPAVAKLYKAVGEFRHYLDANLAFIPNYGDRYCPGEPISSAPAEATVKQVVSKRLVKKQQMRWSDQDAHLLLQLRVKVLNGELRQTFQQRYPGMKLHDPALHQAA